MLLRATHINSAMSLTAPAVTVALHNAGYFEDSVKTATFRGMTPSGSFVYDCTYFDTDMQQDEDAIVYVHFTSNLVMNASY
jgi:hypothetical protein